MKEEDITFYRFAMNMAETHHQGFINNPLSGNDQDRYETLASNSLTEQKKIESQDQMDFSEYLANIYQQYQPFR